jgi:type IV pilus assembly protein PilV
MNMKRASGFSMVEVLVSLVILSIALLGTAGLTAASLRNNNNSYYRSQATVLADDIIDRMRANRTAARDGDYVVTADPVEIKATVGTMARFDCVEWVNTISETMPGGVGTISIDADDVVTIVIRWGEDADNAFTTVSQL